MFSHCNKVYVGPTLFTLSSFIRLRTSLYRVDWRLPIFSFLILTSVSVCRDVFRTQSNIYDGDFFENSNRTLNHLAKLALNDWTVFWVLICMVHLTVCSCHVTYAFQSESTLYSCLNVKELLTLSRRKIWSFSDCNWTRIQNHLVRKRTVNQLAKLACTVKHQEFIAFLVVHLVCYKSVTVRGAMHGEDDALEFCGGTCSEMGQGKRWRRCQIKPVGRCSLSSLTPQRYRTPQCYKTLQH